jgi:hypothetical protein
MNKREVIRRLQNKECTSCAFYHESREYIPIEFKGQLIHRPGNTTIKCARDVILANSKKLLDLPKDRICEFWYYPT